MKLLIIEDEPDLLESIVNYLSSEGFTVESAPDYQSADEKTSLYNYECVVVDISLPDGNGLNIIRKLKREKPEVGIIIISAKNSLDDKLTGLDIGADDYLTKPFHLSELNARVKSIIRRRGNSGVNEINFNEIKIVPESRQVFVNNSEVVLTRKEYDLLLYFVMNKNKVLSKEAIAEHLWGDDMSIVADSFDFLYTHIKNLRKKLVENGSNDYINTVYGIGYKFLDT